MRNLKKVLVTGANGFIGQYVVENLLAKGIVPTIFDRRHSPAHRDDVPVFLGDVCDSEAVCEAVALHDGVIHLAGVLGTSETIDNPMPAVQTNVVGSLNVFQACRQYKVPASYITVGNYWMNSAYALTKTCGERFAWMFNKEHNTQISVVRALNAYGPRQKAYPVRKIIPNFVIPALKGEEIVIYGDGTQVMDMIFVEDVADVMVRSLLVEHGRYCFDPKRDQDSELKFEAGSGRWTTVNAIAETVIELVGKGSIKHVPMRAGEPAGSVVMGNPYSLSPLYNNEVPDLVSLESGLERTIAWYKDNM